MSPNIVQRALAVVDLVSAQLCKHDTSCIRQPRRALRVVYDALLDVTITVHLEHARAASTAGDREGFGRHCEYAERLARRHAPDRLGEVETLLEAGLKERADSLIKP
jgi:hypothetical protein